jgi:hypothetical protein
MSEIVLRVPDDALLALKMSPEEFGKELRVSSRRKALELGNYRLSLQPGGRIPRTLLLPRPENYGVDTFRLQKKTSR